MVNYFLNMLYRNVSHIVLAFTILFVLRIVPAFPYPQRFQIVLAFLLSAFFCFSFLKSKVCHDPKNKIVNLFIYYVIGYLAIGVIKNYFQPSSLFLINQADAIFCLALFALIPVYSKPHFLRSFAIQYFWICPILLLFSLPFAWIASYADILGYTPIFILFIPFLSRKKRWLVVSFMILSIITTSQRIYYLRYAFMLCSLALYYLPLLKNRILLFVHKLFFLIPLACLIAAFVYNFNVFDFHSYLGKGESVHVQSTGVDENSLDDTRTFIYQEALLSATNNDYVLLGRTPFYGYESLFQSKRMSELGFIVKGVSIERISEVHMESIFTWFGLIGVIFYFGVLFVTSRKCIKDSNNRYCKILGVSMAFMWCLLWIEYSFAFTPSYFVFLVLLGLCYNSKLLGMSDEQIKQYFLKIF